MSYRLRLFFRAALLVLSLSFSASVAAEERVWTGPAGGAWDLPAHWTPAGVPGPGDHAIIQGGSPVVGAPASADQVRLEGGSLRLDGGLAVTGRLVWQGGSIAGALTIAPGAELWMTNNATRDLNAGALTNLGTAVLANGSVRGLNASVIHNSGTWDFPGNPAIYTGHVTTNRFVNTGTLRRSSGAGTASIDWKLFSTGPILTDAGQFGLDWDAGSVFRGDAQLAMEVGGDLVVAPDAVLRWQSGTVRGALTVSPGGLLVMTNSATRDLNGGALTNWGTVLLADGAIRGLNGSVVDNRGFWEVRGDHPVYTGNNTTNRFLHSGTLHKTAGNGAASIDWALRSTGMFRTDTGTLNLSWADESVFHGDALVNFTLSAPLTVASNAQLRWNSGTIQAGGALELDPGALLVMTNSATRDLNGGALTNRGTVLLADGAIRGLNGSVIDNRGFWEVRGNHPVYTGNNTTNRFLHSGTLHKTSGNGAASIDWALRSTGVFRTDAGTLNLSWADKSVFHGDAYVAFALGTRLNVASNAVLRWNSGTIQNGGALVVDAGGLLVMTNNTTRDLNGGAWTNRGTVLLADGAIRGLNGSVIDNQGVWEVRGNPPIYSGNNTTNRFQNSGTLLKGAGTGSASIDWPFVSSGAVRMDAGSGTLSLGGGYRQEATGRMDFELAGTTVGSGFGRVQLSGPAAELGGTLGVRLVENYDPGLSNVFSVLTWNGRDGEFAGFDGLAVLTNRSLVANYRAGGLDLVAIAATNDFVTPPTIALQPANQTVINGQTARFDVTANGTRPLHYQWFFDGAPVPGADTFTLSLPNARTNQSGGYFVVVTNSAGSVTSVVATLTVRPVADLVVTDLAHPSDAVAGQPVVFGWRTLNQGSQSALAPWSESVALSTNASGTPAVSLGTFAAMQGLVAAQSLVRTQSFILPGGLDGHFHVVVTADTANQVVEELNEGNNRTVSAGTIRLRSPDLATGDIALLDDNGASVNTATFGQTLTVRWTTTNAGSATAPAPWSDRIYLNDRSNSLSGATLLATVVGTNAAPSAGTLFHETPVTLPLGASSTPGNFFILVATDVGDAVAESREDNNLAAQPLTLGLPPLPDLAVAMVSAPATLRPGETVSLAWTTTNRGSLSVTGAWTETVWLAANPDGSGRAELASFRPTNGLAAAGSLARSGSVTLPLDGAVGPRWFAVTVDSRNDVFEADEANNLGVAPTATLIPAELTLAPAVAEIREDAATPLFLAVTRNGGRSQPLTVTLASSDAGELTVTNQVTIAAGQASAAFPVRPVRDFVVDGLRHAVLTATADGFTVATARVSVVDADLPRLAWQMATNRVREGFTLPATLIRDGDLAAPLTVSLASSSRAQLVPPDSVAFAAGQASVTFALLAMDDFVVEASGEATVTAGAAGHAPATTAVVVDDDDAPELVLTLSRTTVGEGAGGQAVVGTVTRSPVTVAPLGVDLASGLPGLVRLPASVTIPGGAGLATFAIAVTDNETVEGTRTATLTPWIKTGTGVRLQAGTAAVLEVTDDDGPTLALALDRELVAEGLAAAARGTVTRNSGTETALVVSLVSGDPSEATVPASVTIPAGAVSVDFPVASVDDATNDGNRTVTVTADAAGFHPGSATLVVSDVDLPDLVVASIHAPAMAETEAFVSLGYFLRNQGPVAMASNTVVQRVWLATNAVPGAGDVLLGSFPYNGALPPGGQVGQSFSLRMPQAVGDYWVRVEADVENGVSEALESNNARVSAAPVRIEAAYDAVVATPLESAPAGTPVPLSGRAFLRGSGAPARFVPVSLHLTVQGTRRVVSAITDGAGNFGAVWAPLPGEAGLYGVAAAHPGVAAPAVQDGFRLHGLGAEPAAVSVRVTAPGATTNRVALVNPGDLPQSGLAVALAGVPAGWSVAASFAADTVAALGTNGLELVVAVADGAVQRAVFELVVTSAEGAEARVPVTVEVGEAAPRLVVPADALVAGMRVGGQTVVRIPVSNGGGADSGPVAVSLPAVPWLTLLSPNPLPNLAPGTTRELALRLAPSADLPPGRYEGQVRLAAAGAAASVPFEFRALSDAAGSLLVVAEDEFTFYAEGSPRVAGAAVTVRDAVGGAVLTNGVTDALGQFFLADVAEGYYELVLAADGHGAYRGTHFVRPGVTNGVAAFLPRETVRYSWTVVPTEVEDRYRIVVETTFEANVPMPVVTIEPSVVDLAEMAGDEMQVDLVVANHGLVAAEDFELNFAPHPLYTFTPLVRTLGRLPARSAFTVPLTIRRAPAGASVRSRTGARPAATASIACSVTGWGTHTVPCGNRNNAYETPIHFPNAIACDGPPLGPGLFGGGGGTGGEGDRLRPRVTTITDPFPRYRVEHRENGRVDVTPPEGELRVFPRFPALSLPSLCDPCFQKRLAAVFSCLQDFLPSPPPELKDCLKGARDCVRDVVLNGVSFGNAAGCAGTWLDCAQAGKKLAKKLPLLGPLLNGIGCADGICNACADVPGRGGPCGLDVSPAGVSARLRRTAAPTSGGSRLRTDTATLALARDSALGPVFFETERLQRVVDPFLHYFGSDAWLRVVDEDAIGAVMDRFHAGVAGTSPDGPFLSAAEIAEFAGTALPSPLVAADVAAFAGRWNRTMTNYAAGVFFSTQTPVTADPDFIALDLWEAGLQGSYEALQSFENEGVADLGAPWRAAVEDLVAELDGGSGGVCAKVRLRLEQQAVLTRDAFRATLEIENVTGSALEDVSVELTIRDPLGGDSLMKFGLRPPELSGLSAIDGAGLLAAASTGRVSWTFLPAHDAAPEAPVVHLVGGTLRYRQDGVQVTVPLADTAITVHPSPRLTLRYFHERDVFADDPFTDEVEPSRPYNLAVMVRNEGFGAARNFSIASAQPRIVDNEKGLLIDFRILATEVAGQSLVPSLTADFGEVGAGATKIGRWLMASTLQGLFTDYAAAFEHVDDLGNAQLSLIDAVEIHEMNRLVRAGGEFEDGLPDFLVNDLPDLRDLPDTLWLSDGGRQPVTALLDGVFGGPVSADQLQVQLTVATPGGWTYLRLPDPADGKFRLVSIVRSDAGPVSVGTNAWTTDRTFVGLGKAPVREHTLHLLDHNSTGSYTLFYEPLPEADTRAPTSSVAALPAESRASFPVAWSGTDDTGVAAYDVFVSEDGGPFQRWLAGTTATSALYPGTLGRGYAFYSVATDAAGNREAAPETADAATMASRVNRGPVFAPMADVSLREGDTWSAALAATDGDGDPLAYSLLAAPAGMRLNAASGRLAWTTGEADGPSSHLVRVRVQDDGLPRLSATNTFRVAVEEDNTAPVLAALADRTVDEGRALVVTNTAGDTDLPAQTLVFSLGAGAPSGLALHPTTGVLTWTPTDLQGGTTNPVSVIVRDDGVPSLSATQRFLVAVRDSRPDFFLGIGSTQLLAGSSSRLPLTLRSGADLTNVTLAVGLEGDRLTNVLLGDLAGGVGSAEWIQTGSNRFQARFASRPGGALQGEFDLAALSFDTLARGPSAVVAVRGGPLSGERASSSLVSTGSAASGRVFVVDREPILDPVRTDDALGITLYAPTGRRYALQGAPGLGGTNTWRRLRVVEAAALRTELEPWPLEPVGAAFFRVEEIADGGTVLAIAPAEGDVVVEWPADLPGCVLEESPVLGEGADWRESPLPVETVGERCRVSVPPGDGARFFRLRLPASGGGA